MGKPQGYNIAYQSGLAGKATCLRILTGISFIQNIESIFVDI
jgi:hypothetical protein